uniref:RBR-type E3 ubiquitin transferase n=1 Tax=Oryza barthii TaxID=65489 RepID=A0A0D3FZL5_9ORYZ
MISSGTGSLERRMESPKRKLDDESGGEAAAAGLHLLLHEMLLRARREGEEPDLLPDEQLRSNDQLQQDEVPASRPPLLDRIVPSAAMLPRLGMLALEAIYGDNIGIFSAKAGLWSMCTGKFLMVPAYPQSYPRWLDAVKVSSLCLMLDTIWTQQLGQEVVYAWVQWLQSSALSHLGFDDGILIQQPGSMMGPVDVRAVAEIASVESVAQWLISYNEEQCHESFLSGLHDCMICFTEYAGIDFITLPCQHYFCRRCMETYSRMHVTEGTVLKLLCPNDKCGGVIPPSLLKRLLGDTDFERWERLILQKTLDSMSDLAYCPRCGAACLEDKENNAQCPKCFFSFCARCRDRRHIGEKCMTIEEKLNSLQDRTVVPFLSKDSFASKMNLSNEISSIKEVLCSSVRCPHCGTAISRVSGCNHMLCSNCRQSFCYGCGKAENHGHSRYQENLATKKNPTVLIEEVKKELEGELSRQHPCPNCRQPNPKMGNNNHMFCWACQVHYCAQ